MNENKGKMTAFECEDVRARLMKMRTILGVWMIAVFVSAILIPLVSILALYENESAEKSIRFLSDHSSITILLAVFCVCVAILYCVELMNLHKFNSGTLVAGVFLLATMVFSEVNSTASSIASAGSTDVRTNVSATLDSALISCLFMLALGLAYRWTYCTAMSEATRDFSMPASGLWEGLRDLSRIVSVISAVLVFLLKLLLDKFVKDIQSADISYEEVLNKTRAMVVLLMVIVMVSSIVDLILQVRERTCLLETAEILYPKEDNSRLRY